MFLLGLTLDSNFSHDGAIYMKDRASEIYKRLEDQKCTRGRNLEALVAGCIYIACRQEGKPRTVKGATCNLFHIWFTIILCVKSTEPMGMN